MRSGLLSRQALLPGVLALVTFSSSPLAPAQGREDDGGRKAAEMISLPQASNRSITVAAAELFTVYQQVDGNISGRLSKFSPSGTLEPARATAHLFRDSG